jgi:hypothetical protein
MSLYYRLQLPFLIVLLAIILLLGRTPTVLATVVAVWFVFDTTYHFLEIKQIKLKKIVLLPLRDNRSVKLNGGLLTLVTVFLAWQTYRTSGFLPDKNWVLIILLALLAVRAFVFGQQTNSLRIYEDGLIYNRFGSYLPWSKIEGFSFDEEFSSIVFSRTDMKTATMRMDRAFYKENQEFLASELNKRVGQR